MSVIDDVFGHSTNNLNNITVDHTKLSIAFVGNPEQFDDEFDFTASEGLDGKKTVNITPQKIVPSSPLAYRTMSNPFLKRSMRK